MHPFSMYNLVSFDVYYLYNHHLNKNVDYFQHSRKSYDAPLPSFSTPTPPGNHSSEYLRSIQEFVMFKQFATCSQGVCTEISWLALFTGHQLIMEGPAEEHVFSSRLVTIVTHSPPSFTFTTGGNPVRIARSLGLELHPF